MKSVLRCLAFLSVLAFVFGCASKKKREEISQSGPTAMVSDEPLNFASQGSDSGKIPGLNSVHFQFDRAAVERPEQEILKADAAWIKAHPNLKIQIEGHCDQRGSVEYNLALGDRRAKVVLNALVEFGVEKSRLSTISYGEERPVAQGDSDEANAKNRRANFVPLKTENMPAPPLATNH